MALSVGSRVFLCYDVPGRDLHHERYILAPCLCGQGWYVVLTPDKEQYPEQISLLNDDLRAINIVLAGQDLPYGIAPGDC